MIDIEEILSTQRMFDQNKLDVRTITMGISLLGCVSSDMKRLCDNIYDTICTKAEHLVETGNDIAREYGVPIVNKRISVTPIALITGGLFRWPEPFRRQRIPQALILWGDFLHW